MHFEPKRVRLTALAEFDLIEAQNFYAPTGAWVLDHFMTNIDRAFPSFPKPLEYIRFFMDIIEWVFRISPFPFIMISKETT
jgi:hypothetical protein